jgi:hypothetical protein
MVLSSGIHCQDKPYLYKTKQNKNLGLQPSAKDTTQITVT